MYARLTVGKASGIHQMGDWLWDSGSLHQPLWRRLWFSLNECMNEKSPYIYLSVKFNMVGKQSFWNVNPILRWAFQSVRKWNDSCGLYNCYHCCYIFCSAGMGVANGIRWNVTISIKMDTELLLAIWWWWPLHCLKSFVASHSPHWLFVVLDTALLFEISGIIFPFSPPWINKLPMKYFEQSS